MMGKRKAPPERRFRKLFVEHDFFVVEHLGERKSEKHCRRDVCPDGDEYRDGRSREGENAAHGSGAVVERNQIPEEGADRARGEHGAHAEQHDEDHHRSDHIGGLLDALGERGNDGNQRHDDEHGGENDSEQHQIGACGIHACADALHAAHQFGQGEDQPQKAAKAADEGENAQGNDLPDGDMAALDRRDQHSRKRAAFLFARNRFGRHRHTPGKQEHEHQHGRDHGENHARRILCRGEILRDG